MAGNVSGAPAIPGRPQQGLFLTKTHAAQRGAACRRITAMHPRETRRSERATTPTTRRACRGVPRARVPGLRHMRYPVKPQSAEHSRMAFPGMAAKWSRPPRLRPTFERRSRLGLEAAEVRETSCGLDLDLKSWRNVQDPFPLYAWLRDHDPLHWR